MKAFIQRHDIPFNGLFKSYWNNGQLDLMGMLDKDGKRIGLWTEWYETGQKKLEVTYKDGFKD